MGRCHCKSENFDLEIKVDLNTSIYRVEAEGRRKRVVREGGWFDGSPCAIQSRVQSSFVRNAVTIAQEERKKILIPEKKSLLPFIVALCSKSYNPFSFLV